MVRRVPRLGKQIPRVFRGVQFLNLVSTAADLQIQYNALNEAYEGFTGQSLLASLLWGLGWTRNEWGTTSTPAFSLWRSFGGVARFIRGAAQILEPDIVPRWGEGEGPFTLEFNSFE